MTQVEWRTISRNGEDASASLVYALDGGSCAIDRGGQQRVPWWSIGKTALAVAVLDEAVRGSLDLDARLAGRAFTLRQLLQHRSGLNDYGALSAYRAAVVSRAPAWSANEMLQRVVALPSLGEPGTVFGYSNVGYFLLRQWLEQRADRSLSDIFDERVFSPLGLKGIELLEMSAGIDADILGIANGYDPAWVYHGLLVGRLQDAAHFVDRLHAHPALSSLFRTEMCVGGAVGGPFEGRPWQQACYGLGTMCGTMRGIAVVGHTGGGPTSNIAVYSSGTGLAQRTVAAFVPFESADAAENIVAGIVADA